MKTYDFSALSPDYLDLMKFLTWVWTLLIAVLVFAIPWFTDALPWYHAGLIATSVWLLFAILIRAYVSAWYKRYQYALSEEGLLINRGVFWRQMIVVPRNRIQHTDITTGPLERRRALAKLVVHTAGTRDAHVTLHGLPESMAAELRQELIVSVLDDPV